MDVLTPSECEYILQANRIAMGTLARMWMISIFCNENVAGDFIEFGIGRGGTLAALSFFAQKFNKKVHAYDTFCGLPDPTEGGKGMPKGTGSRLKFSRERVVENLKEIGAPLDRIVFHEGVFGENSDICLKKCSVAHVDFDLYDGVYWACKKLGLFCPMMG